eukprot:1569554-Pyramimonas_sp.AAC.1
MHRMQRCAKASATQRDANAVKAIVSRHVLPERRSAQNRIEMSRIGDRNESDRQRSAAKAGETSDRQNSAGQ